MRNLSAVPIGQDCRAGLTGGHRHLHTGESVTDFPDQCPRVSNLAHKRLDEAVLDAYAWPHDLADDQILGRLLALNLGRSGSDA